MVLELANPRFRSTLPATPAWKRLLIFNDLAPSRRRRRCWTTPALALIPALSEETRLDTGLTLMSASPSPAA